MHEVLQSAGPQAAHIAQLWWLTLVVCTVVFVVMMLALAWAVWRAPRAASDTPPDAKPDARRERRTGWTVAAAVAASGVLLIVLLWASVTTDHALARLPSENPLNVRVTAHQWWWEITYDDAQPQRIFSTANELRVPVGRPVVVTLHSGDVIHSFWVPNLHGKKDLIPGRTSTIRFRADREGDYRGRCAEYCGLEHGYMLFDVTALAPDRFEEWADLQRKPAAEPADDRARRGRDLFLSGSCMLCHAVQGTTANAHSGPDLTHIASRVHLGAGRLENTPQQLAAWITDPQKFKPGANMPAQLLPPADLDAIVAYLETLK